MFFFAVAAFVAGVSLLQTQTQLPPLFAAVVLPLFAAAAFALRKHRLQMQVALLLFAFAAGFFWAAARGEWRLASTMPEQLEWRDIVVEGKVKGFVKNDERASRFLFEVERVVSPQPQPLNIIARLADYHNGTPPLSAFADGAKLQMKIRMRPPRENANPHHFDYAGYLFANNIRAAGYVRERESIKVVSPGGGLRLSLTERAHNLFDGAQQQGGAGALLAALVVGDRSQMTQEQWRVLRRTGTAHLFAISGAHLSIAAGFAALLVSFLWRRSQRLTRIMPAQKAALLLALPAAFAYALLAGMGLPVQRSFLMLAAAGVAVLAGGMSQAFYALAFAALVIVALDTWAVLSAGFWLSFAFVSALIVIIARGRRGFWKRVVMAQFLLSLCAMPLTLWFFNQASLISPLANLLAIPVIGFIVLPLALADIFAPGDVLWRMAGWVLLHGWNALDFLSRLPFAAWQPASPPGWLFALAMCGAALLLAPAGFPMRFAGVLPVLAVMLWKPAPVGEGGFRAVVLDVGQGSAVVLHTAKRALMYDAGPAYTAATVRDYLRGEGVRKLDALIVSHDDGDHAGGARTLLNEFGAVRVLTSWKFGDAELCQSGLSWEWDGVVFSLLYPRAADYENIHLSDNDKSCVLRVDGKHSSLLLTGDVSSDTERVLLSRYANGELQAAAMNAPHHGSRFSSSPEFVRAVNADIAVFSSGAQNRFGHPHPDAVSAYKKTNAKIFRTDTDGAIVLHFPPDAAPFAEKWRPKVLRYWHRLR